MTRRFTTRERLRYRLDNSLAKGIWGVLAWLGAVVLLFVIVVGLILTFTGWNAQDESPSFVEGIWYALTRSLDAGTFTGDAGPNLRIVGLAVTIVGIFLVATIIGLISSAIDSRVESLRRGRSQVVESGHTVIIGVNDKIDSVISELVEANASRRDAAVVVLCEGDPVDVGDELRASLPDLRSTRLIVRSGSPTRRGDIALVNPADAKSVIVLLPAEGSDAQVVKTVLALAQEIPTESPTTIVAEIEDVHIAEALTEAVGERLQTVASPDIIARIGAQVSRSPGLGPIYQEFLDFQGDELYSTPVVGAWVGCTYGQALLSSARGTTVGVRFADGRTELNPDPDTVLADGDWLIAIAEDDSIYALDLPPQPWQRADGRRWTPLAKERERTLLIGWSRLAPRVAREIDRHVAQGSALHVLADVDAQRAEHITESLHLVNQEIVWHRADPIRRSALDAVVAQGPFDHILLLSEQDTHSASDADARTMLTLLQLRKSIGEGPDSPSIVAELLDPNAIELTATDSGQDFIVSQRLIGLLLAQLSENPHLAPVLDDLFGSVGAQVAMHPVERYLPVGPHAFGEIVAAGREWGVTVIGIRSHAGSAAQGLSQGIRLNPPKDERIDLGPDDAVIVLVDD